MHKDACGCYRDRAADPAPLSAGYPLPFPDSLPLVSHVGMPQGRVAVSQDANQTASQDARRGIPEHPGAETLTTDAKKAPPKPLKRDFPGPDANNNSNNNGNGPRDAKYQVLLNSMNAMNAMNANLHLEAGDAHGVAMATGLDNGRQCACKGSLLNEQMLEQLNGMSLSERLTPRITLTSVDGDDEGRCAADMLTDAGQQYGLGPGAKFLAVPKLQEVGKERRPPTMVKSV